MASFSPYANLILYDGTEDKLVRFFDFRTKIAGPEEDSNFMKIDTILNNQNDSIEEIERNVESFIKKTGSSEIVGSLSPLNDSSINLGSQDNRWLNIYADNIFGVLNNYLEINGEVYDNTEVKNIQINADNINAIPLIGSNKINGDLIPLTNNNNNLGNALNQWGSVYSDKFYGYLIGNSDTSTNATNHILLKNNPHEVSKEQLGIDVIDVSDSFQFTYGAFSSETFKFFYKVGDVVYYSFALAFSEYDSGNTLSFYNITDVNLRPRFNNAAYAQNYSGSGLAAFVPALGYLTITGGSISGRLPNISSSRNVIKASGSFLI